MANFIKFIGHYNHWPWPISLRIVCHCNDWPWSIFRSLFVITVIGHVQLVMSVTSSSFLTQSLFSVFSWPIEDLPLKTIHGQFFGSGEIYLDCAWFLTIIFG